MNDLLALAIKGHGGLRRWQQLSRFRATTSTTGALWVMKGKPGLLDNVVFEGEIRDQRIIITPFPVPGSYTTWEPYRQTIETAEGIPTAERRDPAATFAGLTRESPWDEFQVAYFISQANWNYFTSPFIFARSDFVTEELEPWHEDGQVWRRLLVTYPDSVVAHCRQEIYHFDDAGLLHRLDYNVDVLGGAPGAHYPSEYRESAGIMVPTRRRVYVRNPDGTPDRELVMVDINVLDVTYS
jgi:hypothetical protein